MKLRKKYRISWKDLMHFTLLRKKANKKPFFSECSTCAFIFSYMCICCMVYARSVHIFYARVCKWYFKFIYYYFADVVYHGKYVCDVRRLCAYCICTTTMNALLKTDVLLICHFNVVASFFHQVSYCLRY